MHTHSHCHKQRCKEVGQEWVKERLRRHGSIDWREVRAVTKRAGNGCVIGHVVVSAFSAGIDGTICARLKHVRDKEVQIDWREDADNHSQRRVSFLPGNAGPFGANKWQPTETGGNPNQNEDKDDDGRIESAGYSNKAAGNYSDNTPADNKPPKK